MLARALPAMQIAFSAALALFEGPAQILCVAALICTLAAKELRGYRPGFVEAGLIVWALAGFVGHVGFEGHASSADTTRPLMALGLFVGLGLARASERTLALCAVGFLSGLTLNAGYGLLQFTVGELPLDPYFLRNPKSGQIWIPGRVFHERASSGLFYNRLRLAHVGVAGVALATLLAMEPGTKRRARAAAIAALLVIGPGVLFTYARMAFVALVVAVGLGFVVTRIRPKIAAIVAGAGGLTAVLFLLTEYGRRRIESLSADMSVRRSMVEAAIQVIRDHPWFGVGHGIYRTAVVPHMPEGLSGVTYTSPHNQMLQVMAGDRRVPRADRHADRDRGQREELARRQSRGRSAMPRLPRTFQFLIAVLLTAASVAAPRAASAAPATWEHALAHAETTGVSIVVELAASWCHACNVFERDTLADPLVEAALRDGWILVRVDVDRRPDLRRLFQARGTPPRGETGLPTLHFLDSFGGERMRTGPVNAMEMARTLRYLRDNDGVGDPLVLAADADVPRRTPGEWFRYATARFREDRDVMFGGSGRGPKAIDADETTALIALAEADGVAVSGGGGPGGALRVRRQRGRVPAARHAGGRLPPILGAAGLVGAALGEAALRTGRDDRGADRGRAAPSGTLRRESRRGGEDRAVPDRPAAGSRDGVVLRVGERRRRVGVGHSRHGCGVLRRW